MKKVFQSGFLPLILCVFFFSIWALATRLLFKDKTEAEFFESNYMANRSKIERLLALSKKKEIYDLVLCGTSHTNRILESYFSKKYKVLNLGFDGLSPRTSLELFQKHNLRARLLIFETNAFNMNFGENDKIVLGLTKSFGSKITSRIEAAQAQYRPSSMIYNALKFFKEERTTPTKRFSLELDTISKYKNNFQDTPDFDFSADAKDAKINKDELATNLEKILVTLHTVAPLVDKIVLARFPMGILDYERKSQAPSMFLAKDGKINGAIRWQYYDFARYFHESSTPANYTDGNHMDSKSARKQARLIEILILSEFLKS